MKDRLIDKIENPAVKKELEALFSDGFRLKDREIKEFLSGDIYSDYLQVFPTVREEDIVRNMRLEPDGTENTFLIMKANQNLYWKATELVKFISENIDSKVVWNFQPSEEVENIMKIITISY